MKMRGGRAARDIIRGAVLLLVVCLVADMSMPLLPGAFRLDPSESIEAAAGRNVTTGVATPDHSLVRSHRNLLDRDDALRARRATSNLPHGRHVPQLHPRPVRAFAPNDLANASDDD
jgi:hypothetical protein